MNIRVLGGAMIAAFVFVGADAQAGVVVTSSPGYSVAWTGTDGDFWTDHGDSVPNNIALASNGSTAFGSSEYGAGVHLVVHGNDGRYGNSRSWLANFPAGDPNPYLGVDLPGTGLYSLTSVAWSRDNGRIDTAPASPTDGLFQYTDRWDGVYTLQISTDPNPNGGSTWTTIATLDYQSNDDTVLGSLFTGYYRHEYSIATTVPGPLNATGVRILTPSDQIAVDELEVYGVPVPEPTSLKLIGVALVGLAGMRKRASEQ